MKKLIWTGALLAVVLGARAVQACEDEHQKTAMAQQEQQQPKKKAVAKKATKKDATKDAASKTAVAQADKR
jgi:hypothetical protein